VNQIHGDVNPGQRYIKPSSAEEEEAHGQGQITDDLRQAFDQGMREPRLN
jgi:hypothetical protein